MENKHISAPNVPSQGRKRSMIAPIIGLMFVVSVAFTGCYGYVSSYSYPATRTVVVSRPAYTPSYRTYRYHHHHPYKPGYHHGTYYKHGRGHGHGHGRWK